MIVAATIIAIQANGAIALLLSGVITKIAPAYEMKWTAVLCLRINEGCLLLRIRVLPVNVAVSDNQESVSRAIMKVRKIISKFE